MAETIGVLTSVLNDRTLSFCEKLVLNAFITANKKRNYWGMDQLSDLFGTTRQTISKAIKDLENKGYVIRERPKGKKYYLTFVSSYALSKYTRKKVNVDSEELMDLFNKVVKGA